MFRREDTSGGDCRACQGCLVGFRCGIVGVMATHQSRGLLLDKRCEVRFKCVGEMVRGVEGDGRREDVNCHHAHRGKRIVCGKIDVEGRVGEGC